MATIEAAAAGAVGTGDCLLVAGSFWLNVQVSQRPTYGGTYEMQATTSLRSRMVVWKLGRDVDGLQSLSYIRKALREDVPRRQHASFTRYS